MEDQKENSTFQIDEKLAKAIVKKHFYFSEHNQESEFDKLPGHYQRAIEREAAFQVKTLAQTEDFADILNKDNMEEAQNLHNAHAANQVGQGGNHKQNFAQSHLRVVPKRKTARLKGYFSNAENKLRGALKYSTACLPQPSKLPSFP